MGLVVTCAACAQRLNISDRLFETKIRGRSVTICCKKCQARIRIDGTQAGVGNPETLERPVPPVDGPGPDRLARSETHQSTPSAEEEPVTRRAAASGVAVTKAIESRIPMVAKVGVSESTHSRSSPPAGDAARPSARATADAPGAGARVTTASHTAEHARNRELDQASPARAGEGSSGPREAESVPNSGELRRREPTPSETEPPRPNLAGWAGAMGLDPRRGSGLLEHDHQAQNGSRESGSREFGQVMAAQLIGKHPSLAPVAVARGPAAQHLGKSAWLSATILGAFAVVALAAFRLSSWREAEPRITREVPSRRAKPHEPALATTLGTLTSATSTLTPDGPTPPAPEDTSLPSLAKVEKTKTISDPRSKAAKEVDRAPEELESPQGSDLVSTESSDAPVALSAASPPEPPEAPFPVVSSPSPVVLSPLPASASASIAQSPRVPVSEGPKALRSKTAHGRLAIDPNADRYRVALPPALERSGTAFAATVRICVSERGTVTGVTVLKSAGPGIDPQIPNVLRRWRYRPWFEDGRAVPFCYSLRYQVGPR
jgi:hypothetical protein